MYSATTKQLRLNVDICHIQKHICVEIDVFHSINHNALFIYNTSQYTIIVSIVLKYYLMVCDFCVWDMFAVG